MVLSVQRRAEPEFRHELTKRLVGPRREEIIEMTQDLIPCAEHLPGRESGSERADRAQSELGTAGGPGQQFQLDGVAVVSGRQDASGSAQRAVSGARGEREGRTHYQSGAVELQRPRACVSQAVVGSHG